MKLFIKKIIESVAKKKFGKEALQDVSFKIEEPKNKKFGNFSCNLAMNLAPLQKIPPRDIANILKENIKDDIFEKVEIAGAGFLNFFLKKEAYYPSLKEIHQKKENYGKEDLANGKRIMIEFVSANPTGPLHIGHGRGAVFGDVLSNLLKFFGYDVFKEYYINDRGKQIKNLGISVHLRKKELEGETISFPDDCYKGEYIKDIALKIKKNDDYATKSIGIILADIKEVLNDLGINFDNWFSENKLFKQNEIEKTIVELKKNDMAYEKDGAIWFRSSDMKDEKDRVLVRSNKETTYFASDIAYHKNKFDRGFDTLINIWGADHHGYIERMKAAVISIGKKREDLEILLVQLVKLFKDKKLFTMSKRKGEIVSLRDLLDEVGKDAVRFMFLSRHHESMLDFDLDIAKKKNNENAVYYVQYVYARISSILNKTESLDLGFKNIDRVIGNLKEKEELDIIKSMIKYKEVLKNALKKKEVHRISFYLMELATLFHSYYNKHKILSDNKEVSLARIYLIVAIKIIIKNGLDILGVSTPNKM